MSVRIPPTGTSPRPQTAPEATFSLVFLILEAGLWTFVRQDPTNHALYGLDVVDSGWFSLASVQHPRHLSDTVKANVKPGLI